ncbi:hypothetical protein HY008_03565 [Candidatus Woesebacteria bacterium]|nr:hypothetical protein [Candidatus Woesebacteria bacterium]
MAFYLVRAKPKKDFLPKLSGLLKQNAFVDIQPFGHAITKGLENARFDDKKNIAVWEEKDFCSPPLEEERKAVLDSYFYDVQVEKVKEGEGWKRIENLPMLFANI